MTQTGVNAVAGAFFATLEHELLADNTYLSGAAARAGVFDFVTWYNAERLHASLGYVSPVVYEQHRRAQPARAAGARSRNPVSAAGGRLQLSKYVHKLFIDCRELSDADA